MSMAERHGFGSLTGARTTQALPLEGSSRRLALSHKRLCLMLTGRVLTGFKRICLIKRYG